MRRKMFHRDSILFLACLQRCLRSSRRSSILHRARLDGIWKWVWSSWSGFCRRWSLGHRESTLVHCCWNCRGISIPRAGRSGAGSHIMHWGHWRGSGRQARWRSSLGWLRGWWSTNTWSCHWGSGLSIWRLSEGLTSFFYCYKPTHWTCHLYCPPGEIGKITAMADIVQCIHVCEWMLRGLLIVLPYLLILPIFKIGNKYIHQISSFNSTHQSNNASRIVISLLNKPT